MSFGACCLLPVDCQPQPLQHQGICHGLVCAPIALQALLWARKVCTLLAQLPPADAQQASAQEQSQQQEQQQQLGAAAPAAEQQQQQLQAEASPAAEEEAAAVAEVQEQLLSAVEAAEGRAAAALSWEQRPPLSGVGKHLPTAPADVAATASAELYPAALLRPWHGCCTPGRPPFHCACPSSCRIPPPACRGHGAAGRGLHPALRREAICQAEVVSFPGSAPDWSHCLFLVASS